MCNTYFIKYITFNQSQIRANGEFDVEKNLIVKRQVFQECTRWRRARDGTKRRERKLEGGGKYVRSVGEALTYKTLRLPVPRHTTLPLKVQRAPYL